MILTILFAAMASTFGGSDQDTPTDWGLIERPADQLTAAAVLFDGSLTLMVRCQGTDLEAVIGGLPPADTAYSQRKMSYGFREDALFERTWWTGGHPSTVFSDVPARTARQWRQGGQVQVRAAPSAGGPATRYVLAIPPSAASIDRVLTACGRPLIDPRDATTPDIAPSVPAGFTWEQVPRMSYPPRALERQIPGVVTLSCSVTDEGRLDACEVESERPSRQGFAAAALRAARGSRLIRNGDSHAPRGGLVLFSMMFMVR